MSFKRTNLERPGSVSEIAFKAAASWTEFLAENSSYGAVHSFVFGRDDYRFSIVCSFRLCYKESLARYWNCARLWADLKAWYPCFFFVLFRNTSFDNAFSLWAVSLRSAICGYCSVILWYGAWYDRSVLLCVRIKGICNLVLAYYPALYYSGNSPCFGQHGINQNVVVIQQTDFAQLRYWGLVA